MIVIARKIAKNQASKELSDIETLAKLLSNPETATLLKALAKQL